MGMGILDDSLPEETEDGEVAVFAADTGTAQLDHLGLDVVEGGEVEFLLAVEAVVRLCGLAGLEAICADDFMGEYVFDEEVVTNSIKLVCVEEGFVRILEAFVHFEVKHDES